MNEAITAIRAALTAAGVTNYYVDAPSDRTYPYALVWSSAGRPDIEAAVVESSAFSDDVGVTVVAASPEGVLTVTGRVRAALAPFEAGSVTVAGRVTYLSRYDSRPVQVDRDVTITNTNRHPAFGVDMYRLVSTPA